MRPIGCGERSIESILEASIILRRMDMTRIRQVNRSGGFEKRGHNEF